ncbi:glycerol-3-phosphate acyltransferase [Paenibacillus sp. GCM10027627]|uniref:glycerol-3-phosphate acyltransferase n=1 Tax=unclassified Paenibacillus TaxID=185978 RepID=UPI003629A3EC
MSVYPYGWHFVIVFFVCYGIGNFCAAIFLSKHFVNKDIREHGSGNAGTTNMVRMFGLKLGAATLVIDLCKGVASAGIAKWIMTSIAGADIGMLAAYFAGFAVIVGHNYPVTQSFKGGKGFATGIGVFLAVNPIATLLIVGAGLLLLFIVDRMSVFALAFFAAEALYSFIVYSEEQWWLPLFAFIYFVLAVLSHWPNIVRLIRKEEKPLGIMKRLIGKPAS